MVKTLHLLGLRREDLTDRPIAMLVPQRLHVELKRDSQEYFVSTSDSNRLGLASRSWNRYWIVKVTTPELVT
jgi:hypothetical protein